MKTQFSLPKDDGFFNRYATLIPTLRKLGVLSQIINAITEVGIIYAVVFSMLSKFWGAYAWPLAVFGAIIGTGVIELGLRKFLPYSACAILHKRYKGLDLWMTCFILVTTLALFACSLTLSFKGSKAMAEAVAPAPPVQNTEYADAALSTGRTAATRTFSHDSAEISARYAGLIITQKAAYSTRIANERQTLADLKNKELRTGQRYESQKQRSRDNASNLTAEIAAKIADLEAAKSGETAGATQRKTADVDRVTTAHTATTADITTQNTAARTKIETRVKTYGSGLAWFTLIFHFILILSVALDEMHKKGSGIEQVAQPNQYHFSESIWAAFWNTVSDKWNYHTRTKIKTWADQTPAPPRPSDPPTLYELADWKPYRVTLPSNAQGFASKNLSLNTDRVSATVPANDGEKHPSVNGTVNAAGFIKNCQQCGQEFTAQVRWAKFCKEECKLDFHEAKHGKRFNPQRRTAAT